MIKLFAYILVIGYITLVVCLVAYQGALLI